MCANTTTRQRVHERDGDRCAVCGVALPDGFEIGHAVDRCAGGTDDLDNVLAMCGGCNRGKPVHRTREEFEAWRSDPRRPLWSLTRRMRLVVFEKVAQGIHQGPPPFGFDRGADDRLVPNEDRDAAATMFMLRIQGIGRREIATIVWEQFGVRIDGASVGRAIRNPAYAGGVKGPEGIVVWDAHEPIVGMDVWTAVQRLRSARPKPPRGKDAYWFADLLFCGCGAPLYPAMTRPGYLLFRCAATLDHRPCGNMCKGVSLTNTLRFLADEFPEIEGPNDQERVRHELVVTGGRIVLRDGLRIIYG